MYAVACNFIHKICALHLNVYVLVILYIKVTSKCILGILYIKVIAIANMYTCNFIHKSHI